MNNHAISPNLKFVNIYIVVKESIDKTKAIDKNLKAFLDKEEADMYCEQLRDIEMYAGINSYAYRVDDLLVMQKA